MIYILFGEDTYRSRQKLKEIIGEYRKKAGTDFNLEKLDAEEGDLASLKNIVQGGSLFSPRKLVVVEGAFSSEKNFSHILDAARGAGDHKDTFLILWDRSLSAEGLKRLEEIRPLADKVQEFKLLTGRALQGWTEEEAKKRGLKLFLWQKTPPPAAGMNASPERSRVRRDGAGGETPLRARPPGRAFPERKTPPQGAGKRLYPVQLAHLAFWGGDLWGLSNELNKMALTQGAGLARAAAVEQNIFQLGDTFFASSKAALGTLLSLLRQGHDDFNLFSYLVNHGRTLLTIKTYLDKGVPVSPHHRLHPFVIKKASALARGLSQRKLQALPGKFFEEDFKIKVGLSNPRESLLRILFNN